jgi:DNA-binding HxlR family transcriptional regulator
MKSKNKVTISGWIDAQYYTLLKEAKDRGVEIKVLTKKLEDRASQAIRDAESSISSTVLSNRLLEIEREGLISRKIYPEIPPKVEYRMTPQARKLETIMDELGKWANRWKSPQLQKT